MDTKFRCCVKPLSEAIWDQILRVIHKKRIYVISKEDFYGFFTFSYLKAFISSNKDIGIPRNDSELSERKYYLFIVLFRIEIKNIYSFLLQFIKYFLK